MDDTAQTADGLNSPEAWLRQLATDLPGVLWSTDRDMRFTSSWGAGLADLGLEPDQIVGKTLFEYFGTEDPDHVAIAAHRRTLGGESVSYELDWGGRTYTTRLAPLKNETGRIVGCAGVAQDVTDLREAEHQLQTTHRFLEIANRHSDLPALLEEIVAEVRQLTGCAAVGVRLLDEQGNIPYQAYEGFSREFYESESRLSIEHDQWMCVNVVKGDADPKLPFYTEYGSFYMNGTTRFLATVPEEPKGAARYVCNEAGYESAALVPIRTGEQILGLIHVADPGENKAPLPVVQLLEKVAGQLGSAIQRVRAEQALAESEARARTLLIAPCDVMLLVDLSGNIRDLNETAARSLKSTPERLVGTSVYDLFSPSVVRRRKAKAEEAVGAGQAVRFEEERNGVFFDTAIHPVLDQQGNVTEFAVCARDITERKQTEQALRDSEDQYRKLVNESLQGVVVIQDFRIVFANHAMAKISGYPVEELLALTPEQVMQIIHPDDQSRVWGRLRDRLAGKAAPRRHECRAVRKDGSVRWLELFGTRIEYGGKPAVQGAAIDVTERKQAEQALRESEARYRALFQQAPDSAVILDPQSGAILEFNDRAHENLGYTREEFQKLTVADVEAVESPREVAGHFQRILRKGLDTFETKHRTKRGEIRHIQVDARVISVGGRRFLQSIWHDVTDRVRAEQRIRSVAKFPSENPNPVLRVSRAGEILYGNKASALLLEAWQCQVGQLVPHPWKELVFDTFRAGQPRGGETQCGELVLSLTFAPAVDDDYVNVYAADVTQRQRAEDALRRAHDELEVRVRERTAELEVANRQLRAQIADRKQAERALRQSEERYRVLVETMNEGIAVMDEDMRFTFVNERLCQMLEYSRDELIQRPVKEIMDEANQQLLEEQLEKRRRGESAPYEVAFVRKDGQLVFALVSPQPLFDAQKRFRGSFAAVTDITKRVQAEEALRESEERYHLLFDAAPVGIGIADFDGRVFDWNRTMEEQTGYRLQELKKRNIAFCYHDPADRRRMLEAIGESGRVCDWEVKLKRKDGTVYDALLNVELLELRGQTRLLTIQRDVTQLKQAQDALRQAERLASIGTLAAGIAHEINNPLGAMVLSAETALASGDQPNADEILERALKNMHASAIRCSQIVKNVLQFARAETSDRWPGDLGEVIRRARDMTRALSAEAEVAVKLELSGRLPAMQMNPTQMEQVFINLISNAVQASKPGSCVTVRPEAGADFIQVLVEDRGRGMNRQQLRRIFDPFYTTRHGQGGMGLGLSIAYGIIQEHGGSIEVESSPRRGTAVRISLPLRRHRPHRAN